jgi:hypothetical protein
LKIPENVIRARRTRGCKVAAGIWKMINEKYQLSSIPPAKCIWFRRIRINNFVL